MQIGFVESVSGQALRITPLGDVLPLEANDVIQEGDKILLVEPSALVVIQTPAGQALHLSQNGLSAVGTGQDVSKSKDYIGLLIEDEFDPNLLAATAAGTAEGEASPSANSENLETADTGSEYRYSARLDLPGETTEPTTEASNRSVESPSPGNDTNTPTRFEFTELRVEQTQTQFQISQPDTAYHSVTEDFVTSVAGNLDGSIPLKAQNVRTAYGEVTVDQSGRWQYMLNNAAAEVQSLNAGQTMLDTFALQTHSGTWLSVQMTIYGSNDVPLITGDRGARVTEDLGDQLSVQQVSASGRLFISDADHNEEAFVANDSIRTLFGTARISAEGAWHYELDSHSRFVQALKQDQIATDRFDVFSVDGTRQTIQIQISGTNDRPLLSGKNDGLLTLGQAQDVSGKLNITDADFGQSGFQEGILQGRFGELNLAADGSWHYTIQPQHTPSLEAGEYAFDLLSVFTLDGTQQDLIIKILSAEPSMTSSISDDAQIEYAHVLADTTQELALDQLLGAAASAVAESASGWNSQELSDAGAMTLNLSNESLLAWQAANPLDTGTV